jgi:16S rRNA processing protein RimM
MRSRRVPTGRSFSKSSKTNSTDAPRHSEPPPAQIRNSPKRVRLGLIAGPHGLSGALRFVPDNPDLTGFAALRRLLIQSREGIQPYELLDAVPAGRRSLKIQLSGIDTIDAAVAQRGMIVYALESDLPPPDPDQFYYFAAVGCEVFTTDGRVIGTIAETFSNGAHDTWIVRDGKREYLIPVIADVVRLTDFVSQRVVIEDIPGLLD